jgi:Mycobacterium membrane protein
MTWHYSGDGARAGDSYTATGQLDPDDYEDDNLEEVVYYEDSTRWRWAAALAGAVLVLAVIGTVVIVRGGDSASTTARITPSGSMPTLTQPVSTKPPPVASTPNSSLPPETVTTVTPSATTVTEAPPRTAPQTDPRTITYTVSGTRQPGDIVTVTYLDESGVPRTDFNITLPWTKTIIAGSNVLLNSVTAVSVASHLNCSITDANGQTVGSQDYNTIATTCNR